MKEHEMDNLTVCAIAAQRLGMSYGKYMAISRRKPGIVAREVPREDRPFRVCKHCGARFSLEGRSHNSLYCSRECQYEAGKARALARYHEMRKGEEAC